MGLCTAPTAGMIATSDLIKESSVALAARLEQFLDRHRAGFEVLPLNDYGSGGFEAAVMASGEPREQVVQATPLVDPEGALLLVHPFDSTLDMAAVARHTGRRLQPLTPRQAQRLCSDCEPGFLPPLGPAYGLSVLVDETVWDLERLVMACGSTQALVSIGGASFRHLLAGADRGAVVIRHGGAVFARAVSLEEVASRLQKLYRLPPMPALALRIMRLTASPEASARELADLIELDPSLTAQIVRYARSALFNYPGEIQSVQEAVTRVLGFDRVAHIALGIASVRAFEIPRQGILGMDQFWRHSLHCAFLCQRMAPSCGADASLAYLCGLLHNFGLLLTGHLFPQEFEELNRLREANPELSMSALEQQVFGDGTETEMLAVGHGAIGGILHRLWQMPDAVVKSAGVHQLENYQGEHESYVLMVRLANGLLKETGVGDEFNPDDLVALSQRLELDEAALDRLREDVGRVSEELDSLALSLSS